MDFFEKTKGFLLEPSKTFDASKEDTLGEATKFYASIAAIYSAILAVLLAFAFSLIGSTMMGFGKLGTMFGASAGIAGAIVFFVLFMILAIIASFIGGAIIHIGVYSVGGRKGIAQTIKAIMYGSTPGLLLGWIPIIGLIAVIWSLVVEIIGVRQFHELTTGRAILGVLIIPIIIVLAAVIAAFIFGMGPPPTPYSGGY